MSWSLLCAPLKLSCLKCDRETSRSLARRQRWMELNRAAVSTCLCNQSTATKTLQAKRKEERWSSRGPENRNRWSTLLVRPCRTQISPQSGIATLTIAIIWVAATPARKNSSKIYSHLNRQWHRRCQQLKKESWPMQRAQEEHLNHQAMPLCSETYDLSTWAQRRSQISEKRRRLVIIKAWDPCETKRGQYLTEWGGERVSCSRRVHLIFKQMFKAEK